MPKYKPALSPHVINLVGTIEFGFGGADIAGAEF
jgi:hypothetical protein